MEAPKGSTNSWALVSGQTSATLACGKPLSSAVLVAEDVLAAPCIPYISYVFVHIYIYIADNTYVLLLHFRATEGVRPLYTRAPRRWTTSWRKADADVWTSKRASVHD